MTLPVIQIEPAAADGTLAHDFALNPNIPVHALLDKLRNGNNRRSSKRFSIVLRPGIQLDEIGSSDYQDGQTQNQYFLHRNLLSSLSSSRQYGPCLLVDGL